MQSEINNPNTSSNQPTTEPLRFEVVPPYATFINGKPRPIPFVVDGLLTEGGLSVLAGPPKMGKSQLSRFEAVAVSRGEPFLGRETHQCEVLLINLEDSKQHLDNCLQTLGWGSNNDARVHAVHGVHGNVEDNVKCLGDVLSNLPEVRLVIIDTLPKFALYRDVNEYMETLKLTQHLNTLLREHFPRVHIQATTHTKKTKTDDVFESILGSTAIRSQTDTNIVLHWEGGERYIAAETRMGRALNSTLLDSEVQESHGAEVVTHYSLGDLLATRQSEAKTNTERKRRESVLERTIAFMRTQPGLTATRTLLMDNITGQNAKKIETINSMVSDGLLIESGTKRSSLDPATVRLDETKVGLSLLLSGWSSAETVGSVQ